MSNERDSVPPGARPPDEGDTSWTRIRRAKGTDDAARKARWALAESCVKFVNRVAHEIARRHQDARDLAQMTLLRILNGEILRGADPSKGPFHGWLARCMWNRYLKDAKARRVRRAKPIDVVPVAAPEVRLDAALDAPNLKEILAQARREAERRLKGHRALPVLVLWLDDPGREDRGWQTKTAQELGIKVHELRYFLKKALGILREEVTRLRKEE